MLDQKTLHEIFEYREGELYWKVKAKSSINIGDKLNCSHRNSSNDVYHKYVTTNRINGKKQCYSLARLIYIMFFNQDYMVFQYTDGNHMNTKIENLTPTNRSFIHTKAALSKNNTTGYKGVHYCATHQKWIARIGKNHKRIFLGSFDNVEQAVNYRKRAEKELYGEFANFG